MRKGEATTIALFTSIFIFGASVLSYLESQTIIIENQKIEYNLTKPLNSDFPKIILTDNPWDLEEH